MNKTVGAAACCCAEVLLRALVDRASAPPVRAAQGHRRRRSRQGAPTMRRLALSARRRGGSCPALAAGVEHGAEDGGTAGRSGGVAGAGVPAQPPWCLVALASRCCWHCRCATRPAGLPLPPLRRSWQSSPVRPDASHMWLRWRSGVPGMPFHSLIHQAPPLPAVRPTTGQGRGAQPAAAGAQAGAVAALHMQPVGPAACQAAFPPGRGVPGDLQSPVQSPPPAAGAGSSVDPAPSAPPALLPALPSWRAHLVECGRVTRCRRRHAPLPLPGWLNVWLVKTKHTT